MVCLNRRALSSALVVMLLVLVGIAIAAIVVNFLHGAAVQLNQTATLKLNESLELFS